MPSRVMSAVRKRNGREKTGVLTECLYYESRCSEELASLWICRRLWRSVWRPHGVYDRRVVRKHVFARMAQRRIYMYMTAAVVVNNNPYLMHDDGGGYTSPGRNPPPER